MPLINFISTNLQILIGLTLLRQIYNVAYGFAFLDQDDEFMYRDNVTEQSYTRDNNAISDSFEAL
jgi:hypothetical protein